MYVRPSINGRATTFGVSGMLWRDALIMFDRQSNSLWSQILGQSVAGPSQGQKLQELPSQLTTWKDWAERHPDTLVLKRPRVTSSQYEQYHYNRNMIGVKGTKIQDKRVGGKVLVFGMERGEDSMAVPMPLLRKQPVLNAEAFGAPIVVFSPAREIAVQAYERTVNDQVLTFENTAAKKGPLTIRDQQTGSTWDWERGVATDGELAGKRLISIEGTVVYWGIWIQYHAGSGVIGESR